jgi:putative toxin-antitoxin system antitoxin component (TIGR02293 family)
MMEMANVINRLLGTKVLVKQLDNIPELVQRGISAKMVSRVESNLSLQPRETVMLLGVSESTRKRWRTNPKSKLDLSASDRLMRLVLLFAEAVQVFHDQEKARHWFHSSIQTLGMKKPVDLAITDFGSQEVRDALTRIRYGMFA